MNFCKQWNDSKQFIIPRPLTSLEEFALAALWSPNSNHFDSKMVACKTMYQRRMCDTQLLIVEDVANYHHWYGKLKIQDHKGICMGGRKEDPQHKHWTPPQIIVIVPPLHNNIIHLAHCMCWTLDSPMLWKSI